MSLADGRAAVEQYRADHLAAHDALEGDADALAARHVDLLTALQHTLADLGYASLDALFAASRSDDAARGVPDEERWR